MMPSTEQRPGSAGGISGSSGLSLFEGRRVTMDEKTTQVEQLTTDLQVAKARIEQLEEIEREYRNQSAMAARRESVAHQRRKVTERMQIEDWAIKQAINLVDIAVGALFGIASMEAGGTDW